MSDLINDGKTRVAWVTSIANTNAPTTTELNAGLDISQRITPDGLKTDPTTADVDTGSLASTTDTNEVGRISYSVEVTLKRGDTTIEDQPYSTLIYGTHGYLVVRRALAYSTAWATGQQVEVYPVVCGERMNIAPTKNEVAKYTAPMKVTSAPATNAVVA